MKDSYNRSIPFYMHDRPKWIVDDMTEKLIKIQEEMKYALLKYKTIFKRIVTLLLQEVKINVKSTHAKRTMVKVYQRGGKGKGNLSSRFWQ